ncbi:hypothetical protein NFI96_000381 [Prochilodus magdalenae]|nr:hypothetical protein NFI96_000381 [Prochilodus magdalenae]
MREMRTPTDLIFGPGRRRRRRTGLRSRSSFRGLRERVHCVHQLARQHQGGASARQKRAYDTRCQGEPLAPGAEVWLFNPRRKKGRCPKLQADWEGPCVIVKPTVGGGLSGAYWAKDCGGPSGPAGPVPAKKNCAQYTRNAGGGSAFNTVVPQRLQAKLSQLSVPDSMCRWIVDFLTDRRQQIHSGGPHITYKETEQLVSWCSNNHLLLNTEKTVEMVVDFRRNPPPLPPLHINNTAVSMVESLKFLGTTISRDLKWEKNTISIIKKAQQRMFFLRQLKKFHLPQTLMIQFYTAIIESILTASITIWFGSSTSQERTKLQQQRGSLDVTCHHFSRSTPAG